MTSSDGDPAVSKSAPADRANPAGRRLAGLRCRPCDSQRRNLSPDATPNSPVRDCPEDMLRIFCRSKILCMKWWLCFLSLKWNINIFVIGHYWVCLLKEFKDQLCLLCTSLGTETTTIADVFENITSNKKGFYLYEQLETFIKPFITKPACFLINSRSPSQSLLLKRTNCYLQRRPGDTDQGDAQKVKTAT